MLALSWRKLLPSQIRPTETNWILVPLHYGNVHANHFEQSHPNIKTTTLVEKCLLCPGGDVVPWLCRWKSMLSQPTGEMFAVNNAPTPGHCSERLPTCPQCLCVACNQVSWNWLGSLSLEAISMRKSRTGGSSHINGTFTLDHRWRRNLAGASAP